MWKVSKYRVFSGPYSHELNTGKYGPEKASYSDSFHAVNCSENIIKRVLFSENLLSPHQFQTGGLNTGKYTIHRQYCPSKYK